ncbi:hypothetical protein RintRC_1793 [Richelia intracellularis]|nr:hypothetical protein RintRC_1793 [Richelia intracellularis]
MDEQTMGILTLPRAKRMLIFPNVWVLPTYEVNTVADIAIMQGEKVKILS